MPLAMPAMVSEKCHSMYPFYPSHHTDESPLQCSTQLTQLV